MKPLSSSSYSRSPVAAPPFDAYPLLMAPELVPKVWGGQRLLGLLHPGLAAEAAAMNEPIGETWELADHPDGASKVANATYAGRFFGELVRAYPREMLGCVSFDGRFPLLVKYIDAAQDLSVQVHPDDRHAARMTPGERGKTECWYVVEAEPGARIVHGLQPGTTREDLRRAVEKGTLQEVLRFLDISPGMVVELPAGTVHALLGGSLICEIQQNSNTTYRFHDWDREPPRPLHIEEALEVASFERHTPPPRPASDATGELNLEVTNDYFQVYTLTLEESETFELETGGEATILNVVKGAGTLNSPHPSETGLPLHLGQTWFLPAALDRVTLAAPADQPLVLLVSKSLELRPFRQSSGHGSCP